MTLNGKDDLLGGACCGPLVSPTLAFDLEHPMIGNDPAGNSALTGKMPEGGFAYLTNDGLIVRVPELDHELAILFEGIDDPGRVHVHDPVFDVKMAVGAFDEVRRHASSLLIILCQVLGAGLRLHHP
jgi:hypothetical protein